MKEKEEKNKKRAKKATNQQASTNFTDARWGMSQKTNIFVPLPRKGKIEV